VTRRWTAAVLAALAGFAAGPAGAGELLYHAETADGRVVASRRADRRFNPASVLKVATAWWALEALGPGHRYVTELGTAGKIEAATGTLRGDLVVVGGGDPDLQPENAFRIARALNRLGVRRVDGRLVAVPPLFFGWDHGARALARPGRERTLSAARRLARALDPARWDAGLRRAWREAVGRDPSLGADPPALTVPRVIVAARPPAGWKPLVSHRSNPLPVLLRRFAVFSNNDIVRVAEPLGGAVGLAGFLRARLPGFPWRVGAASGERVNRTTARGAVALLAAFERALAGWELEPADLLPVPGCDPGPVPRMFPRLARPPFARAAVVKTGTLSDTDGGVAVLAGYVATRDAGRVRFCVAAPGAGRRLRAARRQEERWLLDLVRRLGGPVPRPCPAPLAYPDTFAEVVAEAAGR